MIFIVVAAILHWNHIYHWMEEGIMTGELEIMIKLLLVKKNISTYVLFNKINYIRCSMDLLC